MTTEKIDTCDAVRHNPSGEEWLVAFVENGRLCACGWPLSLVPVTDCTLIEKATPELRKELLQKLAAMEGNDPRKTYAARALAAENVSPDVCYSLDEENYRYDCLGEALQALDDRDGLEVGATLYEGDAQRRTASHFFDIDQLFESMGERASDECGEWADDFPDVTKAKQQELKALIEAWLDANVTVSFYTVANAREIKVTAEMISEHSAEPAAISINPLDHEQSK